MNVTPLRQSLARIGAWRNLAFFSNGQFDKVCRNLKGTTCPVYPAAGNILRAYELVQPCKVRVVILGQDPYHQPGRATGLAFAVLVGQMPVKGSLPNIFCKVLNDPGIPASPRYLEAHCNLTGWARQGVLLLNTALTVPANAPGGHRTIGWSPLITQTLESLAPRSDIAWLLCGYRAKQRVGRLSLQGLVVRTGHPSRSHLFDRATSNGRAVPHPFSYINGYLSNRPIDWDRP